MIPDMPETIRRDANNLAPYMQRLCVDEGCPHSKIPHECVTVPPGTHTVMIDTWNAPWASPAKEWVPPWQK